MEETLRSGGLHHPVTVEVDAILEVAGVVASSCCSYAVHPKDATIAARPFDDRSRVCTLKNSDIAKISKRENMCDPRFEQDERSKTKELHDFRFMASLRAYEGVLDEEFGARDCTHLLSRIR